MRQLRKKGRQKWKKRGTQEIIICREDMGKKRFDKHNNLE